MEREKPDVVIHCAALTDVDKCETETESAYILNTIGSANVAVVCQRHKIRLIAISTDYVFDGKSNRSYNELDKIGSETVYGRSK